MDKELQELMDVITIQGAEAEQLKAKVKYRPYFQRRYREMQGKVMNTVAC